jgi:uncharacterized membrane protein
MSAARTQLLTPTTATRLAVRLTVTAILATALFLVLQYPALPSLLPVHFRPSGAPNGWQFRTFPRVLTPVFVQLALALTLGAITMLFLSRRHGAHDVDAPDVRAAAAAAEAVALISCIWVAFQGYAAIALVAMWSRGRAGLGDWYLYLQVVGFILTGIVAVRARAQLGRPAARPVVDDHWRYRHFYRNPDDPALFVPTRDGRHWTLNFGRPVVVSLLGAVLLIGIVGPTVVLGLALR